MAVTVSYNSQQLVPAPLFSWDVEMVRDSRGSGVALRNTLSFAGNILETSGDASNISDVISSRNSILNALKTDNGELSILENGSGLLSGVYPKITDFTMDEGTWADRSTYTFTAIYEEAVSSDAISDYSESWSYDEDENRKTINLSHSVSAIGLDTSSSGNNALDNARTFVLTRVGSGNQPPSHPAFAQASGTTTAYASQRSEDVDVAAGSFSINETFVVSSGAYIHTQDASMDVSDGITTVSLQGEVKGLGRSTSGFTNALSGWNNLVRDALPADASGVYSQLGGSATLYTATTTSESISKSEFNGSITYNYSYTDDAQENLPSGVESFDINFADNQPTVVYATFPIFGRTLGNVVQNIGTSTEGSISITGSAKAEAGYVFTDLLDYAETRINALRPDSANYVSLRLVAQNVTRDEAANELQFSLQWAYTTNLSAAKINGLVSLD